MKRTAGGTAEPDIRLYCANCGGELDEDTGWLASPDWYKDTRYVHYCRDCQQKQWEDYAELLFPAMAFVLCCAAYNIPLIPEAAPRVNADNLSYAWKTYLENLILTGRHLGDDEEPAAFSDGVTDLNVLFGDAITRSTTFLKDASIDAAAGKLQGTRAQRKKWGTLKKYTTEQYQELDRLYAIQSASFVASGIDDELEFNLREICKLLLEYSSLLAKGELKEAKQTYDIISKMKADNLMRKKDEAPRETKKIDNLIMALERHELAKDGQLLPYDKLLKKLQGDHARYPMSHDLLDYFMFLLYNTQRRNDGLPEAGSLPLALQVGETFGELLPERSRKEDGLIRALNLPPIRYEQDAGKEGGNADAAG